MCDSDKIVWEKMIDGDEIAFSLLYNQFAKQLYLYGLKLTLNTALIEDCIQELFIAIFSNQAISKDVNVEYYLLRSLRNRICRGLTRENIIRHKSICSEEFNVVFSVENEILEEEERNERLSIMNKAISELSSRQKEAIYLRYNKGLNYKEIALIMDMEIESCRNIVNRAIKKMKKSLTKVIMFFLYKCI